MRSFCHALQFLTRLPAPNFADFDPAELSRSSLWFPAVGLLIGALLAAMLWLGGLVTPWTGALLTLVLWVWVTGALHLDGLGDVADGFGAAHRSPERFLEVLRDPHIGAFGVIAIAVQLLAKLVLLAEIATLPPAVSLPALLLVPAWARWGPLVWSLTVPPLASGSGERFSWNIGWPAVAVLALILTALSAAFAPALLAALLIVPAIAFYWRYRLGGITGDCLGASIEATESLLLLAMVIVASV